MKLSELKKKRKAAGLTQMELAKKVGVSPQTIRYWENEAMTPGEKNREALEAVLEDAET